MSKSHWDRPFKNCYRSVAMTRKQNAKVALFFPGIDCLCVREALEKGVISKRTLLIIIEKDAKTMRSIKIQIGRLGFKNVEYCQGDAGDVNLKSLTSENPIDFAFFDFCGQPTPKMIAFLQSCHFSKGAIVSITSTTAMRNNLLPRKLKKMNLTRQTKYITNQLSNPVCYHTYPGFKTKENLYHTLVLLKCGLMNYSTTLVNCHEYNDSTTPMLFVQMIVRSEMSKEGLFKVVAESLGMGKIDNDCFAKLRQLRIGVKKAKEILNILREAA